MSEARRLTSLARDALWSDGPATANKIVSVSLGSFSDREPRRWARPA
jgi:hypothetical protein